MSESTRSFGCLVILMILIVVPAAAAPSIPQSLVAQLKEFGRMVIPVGDREHQLLTCVTRTPGGLEIEELGACQFVPLLGPEAW